MDKAYDEICKKAVKATSAAKRDLDEHYRYVCLRCREEVYLAAVDSKKKSPHFRHKRGNNEQECELYIKTHGADKLASQILKEHQLTTGIYYDSDQKALSISISFSEEEIDKYENKNCFLQIKNADSQFDLISLKINHNNFAANTAQVFPLKPKSNICKIDINETNDHWCEDLLNPDGPTFFKCNLLNNKAKKINGKTIYTETEYYFITKEFSDIKSLKKYKESIVLSKEEKIKLINNSYYYVASVTIKNDTYKIKRLFSKFEYDLKRNNEFSILWPPYYLIDEERIVDSNTIIAESSFSLKPHSNINQGDEQIIKKGKLYNLRVDDEVKIKDSNIDLIIKLKETEKNNSNKQVSINYVKKLKINEVKDNTYWFLFDDDYYEELKLGTYWLGANTKIIKYEGTQPSEIYQLPKREKKSSKELLSDVLKYYKVVIPYQDELFIGCKLSHEARQYIEECKLKNVINKKVIELIKVGAI